MGAKILNGLDDQRLISAMRSVPSYRQSEMAATTFDPTPECKSLLEAIQARTGASREKAAVTSAFIGALWRQQRQDLRPKRRGAGVEL
jgi:hypothetical protein